MSDYNDKNRPRLESIASMEGRTSYKEPWAGGPSGDAKGLREVMAPLALGLIRRTRGDIDPLLLQTYVGGRVVCHTKVIDAYLLEQPAMSDLLNALTQLSCMIALGIVAGQPFNMERARRVCEFADVSEEQLQALVRDALTWIWARVDKAATRYLAATDLHEAVA